MGQRSPVQRGWWNHRFQRTIVVIRKTCPYVGLSSMFIGENLFKNATGYTTDELQWTVYEHKS